MKFRVEDIAAKGMRLHRAVDQADFQAILAETGTGFSAIDAIEVEVRLERSGQRVLVEGTVSSRVECPCTRCLRPIETPLPVTLRMDLWPSEQHTLGEGDDGDEVGWDDGDERAGSFALEDAERDYYDGDVIDLWPFLREHLLLALPDYPLCNDECRGLCQSCGIDLNNGDCACDQCFMDPRWQGLSKIKVS